MNISRELLAHYAANSGMSDEVQTLYLEKCLDPLKVMEVAASVDSKKFNNFVSQLIKDQQIRYLIYCATFEALDCSTQKRLLKINNTWLNCGLSRNLALCEQAQLALCDQDLIVRIFLSMNPRLSVAAISKLFEDNRRETFHNLAANYRCPASILEAFAEYNHDPMLRGNVARNSNTPISSLTRLADAKEWFIRIGVYENPSTPTKLRGTIDITKPPRSKKVYLS